MAYSNYQIPNKITFYPSYLQYAYATGLIESVSYDTLLNPDLTQEDIYNMVVVDPSNITRFNSIAKKEFPDLYDFRT